MVAVVLCPAPVLQFFDNEGNPAINGTLLTQIGGVNYQTYSDSGGSTPLPNPIPLNSRGEVSTAVGATSQLFLVPNVVYTFTLSDANGNQLWQAPYVAGGTTLNATSIVYPQTAQELAAAVTPATPSYFGTPWLWVRREGCVLDGASDDSNAFNICIAVAATTNTALLIDGPCYLNSNITIPSNVQLVFVGAGTLKPGSGKAITLGQVPQAGLWQIFDYSAGGTLIMPNSRTCEVWAEWWGANGDGVTNLANDVALNAALAAISNAGAGSGGTVRMGVGAFYISAVVDIAPYCSLRGMGNWTLIKAKTGWAGGTTMLSATNATAAIFDSRVENIRFDANYPAVGTIEYILYVDGWQERCGVFDCSFNNFAQYGFYYAHDRGAAQMELKSVDFFPADVNNAIGAYLHDDATGGYMKLQMTQVSVASGGVNSTTGVQLDGHIIGCCQGIDIETIQYGIVLSGGAILTGSGIGEGLATGISSLIRCAAAWAGTINAEVYQAVGSATPVLSDASRSYAIAALQPYDGQLIWPPNLGHPVGVCEITGGGTPVVSSNQGVCTSTISHQATGQQRLTLSNMDGTTKIYARADSMDASAPRVYCTAVDATHIDIFTAAVGGSATDAATVFVQVFHTP